MNKTIQFPNNFFWGTSTAFAQIETASNHNWKGIKARDGYVFERTCDHELRRNEDINYITQFGSVYRCSLDWARLQTSPNADFDTVVVNEYDVFLQKLTQRGMKIMLVIHHFTNPIWFEEKGGWERTENVDLFIDFAEKLIKTFGKYATHWNTINEPEVYASNAYFLGNFPPFVRNIFRARKVVKNLGKAHDRSYDLIKKYYPSHLVGISKNSVVFYGLNVLGKLPAMFGDWWFMNFIPSHFEKVDFFGMSYYTRMPFDPFPVSEVDTPGKLKKLNIPHDMMWEYYPKGMYECIMRYHQKYNKPIIITESGTATNYCSDRINAINDYLYYIHKAMQEGAKVIGYIHWSTFDNFEWNLGCTYRFGLVHVDFENNMKRTLKESGAYYASICNTGSFSLDTSKYV